MPVLRPILIVSLMLAMVGSAVAEPLRLVASIHPLALLAQAVVGDNSDVVTLMEPGVTPHDFAFRVSHRKLLAEADLVLWVGPELEPYLQGPLKSKRQLSLEGLIERGSDTAGNAVSHAHVHGEHTHDPHLWLSPSLATAMLTQLAELLAELRPEQGPAFHRRAQQQIAQLSQLTVVTGGRAARPYAMAHAALGELLEAFKLPQPLLLSASPEIAPGARSLRQLQQQLQPGDCLLVEWPGPRSWQQQLATAQGYRQPVIDLMGYGETVGDYYQLLDHLLQQLQSCIYGAGDQE